MRRATSTDKSLRLRSSPFLSVTIRPIAVRSNIGNRVRRRRTLGARLFRHVRRDDPWRRPSGPRGVFPGGGNQPQSSGRCGGPDGIREDLGMSGRTGAGMEGSMTDVSCRVVDADGHVLEPADTWLKYLEPSYRDRAIRIARDDEGYEVLLVDRRPLKTLRGQLGAL